MKKIAIGRFIDPLTDFGFKLLFGSEPNKDLLIDFLNQVLRGKKQVAELEYNKNEQPGYVKDARKAIYDLRCTGLNGEQFIIEVQKVQQDFFKDRSIYYTSALVHEQGPKGGNEKWDYRLPEIYFIGLMDFAFDATNENKYLHDIALLDMGTKETFYGKLGYTFIEIPKFKKAITELKNRA
jgi:predicted transposase/invertase (TIGR01784 family)